MESRQSTTHTSLLKVRERCRAAGFVTHLTKPIRVEALDAALRDSLEGAAAGRG